MPGGMGSAAVQSAVSGQLWFTRKRVHKNSPGFLFHSFRAPHRRRPSPPSRPTSDQWAPPLPPIRPLTSPGTPPPPLGRAPPVLWGLEGRFCSTKLVPGPPSPDPSTHLPPVPPPAEGLSQPSHPLPYVIWVLKERGTGDRRPLAAVFRRCRRYQQQQEQRQQQQN